MHRRLAAAVQVALVLGLILSFGSPVYAQSATTTATPRAATATLAPTLTPTASPTATTTATAMVTSSTPAATATPGLTPTPVVTTPVSGTAPLELTIYNQDIALIKTLRILTLTAGINLVQVSDIAAQVDPTSVYFISLTDPTRTLVLEQNYEYDLADSNKLLDKYIDQEIIIRTINGEEFSGILLSRNPDLVIKTLNELKVIKQDQVQEYTFPELPSGLITRPSLSWLISSAVSGPQQIRITYLTGGITWAASYVVFLSADADNLALNGWITLQNDSGAAYNNAKVKFVAGDINLVQQFTPAPNRTFEAAGQQADTGVTQRNFFEYHLYEVQRLITVRQGEIKQVEFIAVPGVVSAKSFVYEATPRYQGYGFINDGSDYSDPSAKVQVRLQFTNSLTNSLGIPLPQGIVRVYQQDSAGGAEFVGEDTIMHTPKDETVSLLLGYAFDLTAQRRQVQYRQLSDHSAQETWEVTLRNHKDLPAEVQVIENLFRAQDAEILSASTQFETISANRIRFSVEIEPGAQQAITYTVLYRW